MQRNKSNIDQYNIKLNSEIPNWLCNYQAIDEKSFSVSEEEGIKFLFYGEQYYVQQEKITKYIHTTKHLVNMDGVQGSSNILIDFYPDHTQLLLHQITVQREGITYDKLSTAETHVFQRELRAEYNVFSGQQTLSIILNDIRPGDILDLKYSCIDFSDSYINFFNCILYLKLDFCLYKRLIAIISDPLIEINYHIDGDYEIVKTIIDEKNVLQLNINNQERLSYPKYEPYWYKPKDLLQVCVNLTWEKIAKHTEKLSTPIKITNKELIAIIENYNSRKITEEELVLNVLKYIHDNVRYLANYKATHSFIPSDPNVVCERGYGDCKDLSHIIHCILQSLKIDSSIVLVNDRIGKVLNEYLPSPALFNHAIIRVKINENYYFIDPTIRQYTKSLEYLYLPNFGLGLVCNEQAKALCNIINLNAHLPAAEINDTYKIRSWHENQITFSSKITYSGKFCLLIIAYLERHSETEFWKIIEDKYAIYFSIKEILENSIDKSKINESKITINVSYNISAKLLKAGIFSHTLEASIIDFLDVLDFGGPRREELDSDFYIQEPRIFKYTITFNDDAERRFRDHEDIIEHDAFSYRKSRIVRGSLISFCQEFIFKTNIIKKEKYGNFYEKGLEVIELQLIRFNTESLFDPEILYSYPARVLFVLFLTLILKYSAFDLIKGYFHTDKNSNSINNLESAINMEYNYIPAKNNVNETVKLDHLPQNYVDKIMPLKGLNPIENKKKWHHISKPIT